MTLRIGLVGCGRVARTHHGPILARMQNARVTCLIDSDAQARRDLGRVNQGAVFLSDVATAVQLDLVDALVVCTPPHTHAATAISGLEAGLDVYVEKPVALTLREADSIAAAAEAAGKTVMVGHNFRFHPGVEDLRRRITDQNTRTVAVHSIFTSERRALPGWKMESEKGGDAIFDLAIHHFDLLAYLTGSEVDEGSIAARGLMTDAGSAATITGILETGQPFSIMVSQLSGQSEHKIAVLTDNAHFELDLLSRHVLTQSRPTGRMSLAERFGERFGRLFGALDIRGSADPSFERALGHFVSLASGTSTAVENRLPVSAGRRSLALALAARANAEASRT